MNRTRVYMLCIYETNFQGSEVAGGADSHCRRNVWRKKRTPFVCTTSHPPTHAAPLRRLGVAHRRVQMCGMAGRRRGRRGYTLRAVVFLFVYPVLFLSLSLTRPPFPRARVLFHGESKNLKMKLMFVQCVCAY